MGFFLERRRVRLNTIASGQKTLGYFWGNFQAAGGLVVSAIGLVVAVVLMRDGSIVAGILCCFVAVLYGIPSIGVIRRQKWAWITLTVLSISPINWIINYFYGRNRWAEFGRETAGEYFRHLGFRLGALTRNKRSVGWASIPLMIALFVGSTVQAAIDRYRASIVGADLPDTTMPATTFPGMSYQAGALPNTAAVPVPRVDTVSGTNATDVNAGDFVWDEFGNGFTFSLRNTSDRVVSNATCLIVFYDEKRNAIGNTETTYTDTIGTHLAVRVHAFAEDGIKDLTSRNESGLYTSRPRTPFRIRVVSYDVPK